MPIIQRREIRPDSVLWASEDQFSAVRSTRWPPPPHLSGPFGDGMLPATAAAIFRAFPQEEKDIP